MGLLPDSRVWHMQNLDTGEVVDGDFEAVGVTRNVTTSYSRKTTLNRQDPITQFLHGNADTLVFQARIFRRDVSAALFGNPAEKLEKLIEWTKRDEALGRPPVINFWIGDGDPVYGTTSVQVIDSITDITYDSPVNTGAFRGATFTVNLSTFAEFTLENDPPPRTRFAHAKEAEYFELLAAREYGEPLLGDIVRQDHPNNQIIQTGDVIRLPSKDAIRGIAIVPRSLQLKGLTSNKPSAQRDVRAFHLDRLNRTRASLVIPEGL